MLFQLLRHDGEVESAVVEDDAVLVLGVRGRTRFAQKRRSHHRVPRVLQGCSRCQLTESYVLTS